MKTTTLAKIIYNHLCDDKNTKIGRYWYNVQYDSMADRLRIIRCPDGYQNNRKAVVYNFCGESVGETERTYWEWKEAISREQLIGANEIILNMHDEKEKKTNTFKVRIVDDCYFDGMNWIENNGHWEDDIQITEDATKKDIVAHLYDKGYLNTKDLRKLNVTDEGDLISIDTKKGEMLVYLVMKFI